jgi:DnaK suppressor protein
MEDHTVMSIAQGEAREITQIDNTLKKIEEGKYGVCDCCGSDINKHRLMAIPFVSLCVKCKEAEERDERIMINRGSISEYEGFDEVGKIEG